jgi:hypothetical protein
VDELLPDGVVPVGVEGVVVGEEAPAEELDGVSLDPAAFSPVAAAPVLEFSPEAEVSAPPAAREAPSAVASPLEDSSLEAVSVVDAVLAAD